MLLLPLLSQIREALSCPSLELRLQSSWASSVAGHRDLIRDDAGARLGADVSDLSIPPASATHSISIAHCPELGGFALTKLPVRVGSDVELTSRVQGRTVARIASPEELAAAPAAAMLWTAKEAAYKSLLGQGQPKLISELGVGAWTRREPAGKLEDFWSYRAFFPNVGTDITGDGVVFPSEGCIIAIFTYRSST